MLKKFFTDFLSYQFSHILGGRSYDQWAKQTLVLHKNIPIKNKKLAKELERVCQKHGFLTYAQFLTIDQFGINGYHETHRQHGMTDTKFRWPEALATLCQTKGFSQLVEFGPGDGEVGAKTLHAAKKLGCKLSWSGVEINETLREKAKRLFQRKKLAGQLKQLVTSIEQLHVTEPCLFVFSYSIDNLIPEVFINTTTKQHIPTALLGVTVKNGLLSEIVLSENDLRKTGCTLTNGIYKDSTGDTWDLRQWQLHPMQRAYLPLQACRVLEQVATMLPQDSQLLIIDEFRTSTHAQTYHLGIPRDLETFSRDFTDFAKFYKTAGENLLYFPPFVDMLTAFLTQLGFSLEVQTGEHKLALQLSGRTGPLPKHPRTLALLTGPKEKIVIKKPFVLQSALK